MNSLTRVEMLFGALLVSGCIASTGQWGWTHHDQAYADRNLQTDIELCELETEEENIYGPFSVVNSRPYGEWGDFTFEFCMEEKGWQLAYRESSPGYR